MSFSHSFLLCRVYYSVMACSKRGFFVISFSLLLSVVYAASSTLPGFEGFPPFPSDQEVDEEDFFDDDYDQAGDDFEEELEEEFEEDDEESDEYLEDNPEDFPEDFPKRDKANQPDQPPRPPKDADKIFYYRGNRTYYEDLPLKVSFVRGIRTDNGDVILMIVFNQSVNPRSVKAESFFLEDEEFPEDIRFSFNKKGDTIRVILPDCEEEFTITVQDVLAFNGECIEPVELLVKVED